MKRTAFAAFAATLSLSLWAQAPSLQVEPSPDGSDQMFQEGPIQSVPDARVGQSPEAAASLLKTKAVTIGGYLFSDYSAFVTWADAYPEASDLAAGASNQLVPDLKADVILDGRPYDYFRVFGKFRMAYPFSSGSATDSTQASPFASPYSPRSSDKAIPNISIFELYADVDYREKIYIRAGQQVVNWGVGYFFSPADVLSRIPINPLLPTLEREGPLALKVNVPCAEADNFYLYAVVDRPPTDTGALRLTDVALAPKAEFVIGGYELGIGGYYGKNRGPKAMLTASGSILGNFGLFGEGVLSRGADRIFVESAAPGTLGLDYRSYADSTSPYLSWTVGANYLDANWHLKFYAQYYYNGEGYADSASEQGAIALYGAQQGAAAAIQASQGPLLSESDLFQPGRRYLAGAASWTDIRGSNIDLGIFYEGNLSDDSGVLGPSIAYGPFQKFTIGFAPYLSYGRAGTEFVSQFGYLALSLKLTIGEGAF